MEKQCNQQECPGIMRWNPIKKQRECRVCNMVLVDSWEVEDG